VREAVELWLRGAETGDIRNRSGQAYKPSTLRGYRQALGERVLPAIGAKKLGAVVTAELQSLIDEWQAEGHPAGTIRNWIKPLQAVYRRARSRGGLAVNPTRDLELPAARPREVEVVSPQVAAKLLAALPLEDRAAWATAVYAGLRYGELRALRWAAVNFDGGAVEVRESWDPVEGTIEPKTRTSRRRVPMPRVLDEFLRDHRARRHDASATSLVFGRSHAEPFHAATLYRRADDAWKSAQLTERLRLHQARHTYASFMIAAGVNAKALATYMGHSSIKVTFDLYGHLMPGSAAEAAALLDAFLARVYVPGGDERRLAA
jgi:integrase